MSNPSRFRVSLHVSHPTQSAEEIAASFEFQPKYARSIGARRITKLGEDLGGVYSRTDISFLVSNGLINNDETLLPNFVERQLENLPLEVIDGLVASGGACFFFIGIYSDENILCDFSLRLLSKLAKHGIGLKLDFYGGPDVVEQ